ncbi:hypothetical protein BGZ80_004560, partial [Entomortierella chlamydospora]
MDAHDIHDDEVWVEKALFLPHMKSEELNRQLQLAYEHKSTFDNKENIKRALHNLSKIGLVVEDPDVKESSSPLAQHIVKSLQTSPPHFLLQLDDTTIELPRSRLLFRRISEVLGINIYVFSSRVRPILFNSQSDQSIGIFHRADSVNKVSDYVVLIASEHLHVPELEPFPLEEQEGSYQSQTPAATFRKEERQQKRPRPGEFAITQQQCRDEFKNACLEHMRTRVEATTAPVFRQKKFKKGESLDSVLTKKRHEMEQKFLAESR